MKITLAFALVAGLLSCATADAEQPAAAPQIYDPTKCEKTDKKCILDWYAEYKPAIIEEYLSYRALETPIADILRTRSDLAANALAGELIRRQLYKHNHWKFVDAARAVDAGIDFHDIDVLLSDCRTAIIGLKFILIEASSDKMTEAAKDRSEYLENARACEKRFHLPQFNSALRQ